MSILLFLIFVALLGASCFLFYKVGKSGKDASVYVIIGIITGGILVIVFEIFTIKAFDWRGQAIPVEIVPLGTYQIISAYGEQSNATNQMINVILLVKDTPTLVAIPQENWRFGIIGIGREKPGKEVQIGTIMEMNLKGEWVEQKVVADPTYFNDVWRQYQNIGHAK